MMPPRDFDIGVARQLAQSEKQASRINSYAVGPGVSDFYADYSGLIGLRGLWYPGVADNTGAVYDASGQGRTLTYNGNPTLAMAALPTQPVLLPYYALDGTGDFFSRADEAGLDILGTETYIAAASRGLTMGGWFQFGSVAGSPGLLSKQNATGAQRGFLLRATGGAIEGRVSVNGTAEVTVTGAAVVVDTWYFLVYRFAPSAELAVFVNDEMAANTVSVPASVFNNTAAFQVGAYNAGTNLLTGKWALSFLCAAYLPDYMLTYLWKRGQVHFGI